MDRIIVRKRPSGGSSASLGEGVSKKDVRSVALGILGLLLGVPVVVQALTLAGGYSGPVPAGVPERSSDKVPLVGGFSPQEGEQLARVARATGAPEAMAAAEEGGADLIGQTSRDREREWQQPEEDVGLPAEGGQTGGGEPGTEEGDPPSAPTEAPSGAVIPLGVQPSATTAEPTPAISVEPAVTPPAAFHPPPASDGDGEDEGSSVGYPEAPPESPPETAEPPPESPPETAEPPPESPPETAEPPSGAGQYEDQPEQQYEDQPEQQCEDQVQQYEDQVQQCDGESQP